MGKILGFWENLQGGAWGNWKKRFRPDSGKNVGQQPGEQPGDQDLHSLPPHPTKAWWP